MVFMMPAAVVASVGCEGSATIATYHSTGSDVAGIGSHPAAAERAACRRRSRAASK
jgi:hypothetical protein